MKSKLTVLFLLLTFTLQAKEVIVYHTSDTHGYYFAEVNAKGQMQGGAAALAAYIKKDCPVRANCLLLDSGDFLQGNAEADASKGKTSVEVFNALDYNALTIGNHDFDFKGQPAEAAKTLLADILAANIEGIPNSKPYKIYTVNGARIAVLGIGRDGEKNKDYKIIDDKEAFLKTVKAIAAENADVVILLDHGSNYDPRKYTTPKELLAAAPKAANIVLNGHMHDTRIEKTGGVLYVDSGAKFKKVSRTALTFDDKTGKLKKAKAKIIPLLISKTGEDADVKAFTEKIRKPEYDEVLAISKNTFSHEPVKKGYLDTELGNFTADILKNYLGADIGIVNTKNFKDGVLKGPYTKRQLVQTMPYDNKLASMTLEGKFLRAVITESMNELFSSFQYSGVQVKAEFKDGKLINADIKINGAPLDDNKKYTVATNEFITFINTYEAVPFKAVPPEDKKLFEVWSSELLLKEIAVPGVKPPKLKRIKVIKK